MLLAQMIDSYGGVYASAGPRETHYGWTGEQVDASGLVYLRARYYSPLQGRFFQRDTWRGAPNQPQTLNPYMYGLGNPVLYTDPSGHCVLGWDCPDWIEDMGDYLFDVVGPFIVGYAVESLDNIIPFVPFVSIGADIAHLIDPCSPRLDEVRDPYFQMGRQAARNTALAISTVGYLGGIGLMSIGVADIAAGGAVTIGSGGTLVIVNAATVTTGLALIEVGAVISATSALQIASITIRERNYPIPHHYSPTGGSGGGVVRRTAAGRPLSGHAADDSLRRHGFRPPYDDVDDIIDNPTWVTEQMDGADIYIQRTGGGSHRSFDYVVMNKNGEVVTAHQGLELDEMRRIARNNGWDWIP